MLCADAWEIRNSLSKKMLNNLADASLRFARQCTSVGEIDFAREAEERAVRYRKAAEWKK